MEFSARVANLKDIASWRDMYRSEMACQIVHESIHERQGWSDEYMLFSRGTAVGYGSVAVAGPWQGASTAYEFYVAPPQRLHLFELFRVFLETSRAVNIEVQSNAVLATTMLHTFAGPATSESVLFHDKVITSHRPPGAMFRHPVVREVQEVPRDQLRWHGVVEVDGKVAASGGILFHYNRPYGDIYMETVEAFRRRGLGSFLVQELKRVCYEGGHVPAARCSPKNIASRRTLQRAGFVPCGHILKGAVRSDAVRRNDAAG
jgi:GNAT superfamily N-acetyltransferase